MHETSPIDGASGAVDRRRVCWLWDSLKELPPDLNCPRFDDMPRTTAAQGVLPWLVQGAPYCPSSTMPFGMRRAPRGIILQMSPSQRAQYWEALLGESVDQVRHVTAAAGDCCCRSIALDRGMQRQPCWTSHPTANGAGATDCRRPTEAPHSRVVMQRAWTCPTATACPPPSCFT